MNYSPLILRAFGLQIAMRQAVSPLVSINNLYANYLEILDWDKTFPGPELPAAVITQTTALYQQAQQQLMGVGSASS